MTEIPSEASLALPLLQRCLGDSLLAAYLYGSAVAGGLRPNSDVDLLAVVDRPMTPEERRRLVTELLQISGRYPPEPGGPRPIELLVFHPAALDSPAYPRACEFLYGEWLRQASETGAVPEPHANPDFTLVLAQARQQATTLVGPPPAELLPTISDADIRRAIGDALPALLGFLEGDERNVLLTLARMWRTLATGELVPKDIAADWAISHLPRDEAALMAMAREGYLGTKQDDWQDRQHDVGQLANALGDRVTAML